MYLSGQTLQDFAAKGTFFSQISMHRISKLIQEYQMKKKTPKKIVAKKDQHTAIQREVWSVYSQEIFRRTAK